MLHVTDETKSGGVWISELDRIGTKKLNRIEYTMFYGRGKTDLLYWQNKELPEAYRSERISIFGTGIHKEQAARLEGLLEKVDAPHMTVVIGANQKPFMKGRFVMSDQVDAEILETRLIQYGVMARYDIASSERMTANIAASLLIGEPYGNGAAKKAYEKISGKLSANQLEQLNKKLGSTSKLNPETLDQLIGDVSGLKTTFLENARDEQYGFYFEDPREIKVNGEKAEGVSVLLEDGQVFYSGKELFSQLGYTLESNQQSIYVTNKSNKYRFSLLDPFYVLNERKYSLRTEPYKKMNGAYYFEEDAIKRIFSLKIQKTDGAIDVTSAEGKEGETDK